GVDCAARILRFSPTFRASIPMDGAMSWVIMDDLCNHSRILIPRDLVLFPLPADPDYVSYFGASTNGLASGNSITEATFHAVLEVIERDIESFRLIHDDSLLVVTDSLPEVIRSISDNLECNDLRLVCRFVPNQFGIPFFWATILENSHYVA